MVVPVVLLPKLVLNEPSNSISRSDPTSLYRMIIPACDNPEVEESIAKHAITILISRTMSTSQAGPVVYTAIPRQMIEAPL